MDHGDKQRMQSEMPATDGPPTDTYTIIAGLEVGKLGITFNGMPPGRIDVKGLAENSFGNDAGVREGDALTEVGKDELMPLEGMDSETFKRLLKDRPLKMKFQSRGQAVAAGESVSPNDAEVAAPYCCHGHIGCGARNEAAGTLGPENTQWWQVLTRASWASASTACLLAGLKSRGSLQAYSAAQAV